jgi:hypothetical protein
MDRLGCPGDSLYYVVLEAAYIGGVLLMPRHSVTLRTREIAMREARTPPVEAESDLGQATILSVT